MKKWLPLLLCLLVPSAFAGLYKWVDTDGNIHYTDTPPPQGAEEVTLPPNVTYTPAETPSDSPASAQPAAKDDGKYKELVITSPKMNETVRSDKGEVLVEYTLTPNGLKPGHQFRMMLDGKSLETELTQEQAALQQLERGSHTIQVYVVDATGTPLLNSQPVIFFLRQESELDTGDTGSGTADNTKSYQPDYERDPTEDQSSEYQDATTPPTSDEGIPQHQDESDFGTDVTDPADSRDSVYDPENPSYKKPSDAGTGFNPTYTPNYNQKQ